MGRARLHLQKDVDADEEAELRRLERGLPSEMLSVEAGDDAGLVECLAMAQLLQSVRLKSWRSG